MSRLSKYARERVWVVTGAASGIGREMVRHLLSWGAVVWALDFDKENLEELKKESLRNGTDLYTYHVDVTSKEQMNECIERIKRFSRNIDVWINNAGIQRIGPFSELSSDDFDKVMDINFHSVVHSTRKILNVMTDQGRGIILNMASVAAHVPAPFMASYVASKHAVLGFSRGLKVELEFLRSPIRCAVASPGFVDTPIIERGKSSGFPEWLSWMLSTPESCAKEILSKLISGDDEIMPTLNGRTMIRSFKIFPEATVRSSKLLLTGGLKDMILNRYMIPGSR